MNSVMKGKEIEDKWQEVTGELTETAERFQARAVVMFGTGIAKLQDMQTKQLLIEHIESEAVIMSGKKGIGVLMMPLENWNTIKEEIV